jgi:hypothetical protein
MINVNRNLNPLPILKAVIHNQQIAAKIFFDLQLAITIQSYSLMVKMLFGKTSVSLLRVSVL